MKTAMVEETLPEVLAARSYAKHVTFDAASGLQVQPSDL